ncbi:hypothetical protein [Spartinivicinus poritis]|uniref:Uncharacterized protein n=1 Tax=Spartinivicinus poritis TaxID=2994640 RepID=A0ABT5U3T9_9GAMM|nr:hypothetical protein [Spartinivicinus sp. A2-2]MDE1461035.1 hypothetical protein [Spartinivicinus sp. A2-2]
MLKKSLIIEISKNDSALDDYLQIVSMDAACVAKRYWKNPDLHSYNGNKIHPITLLSHANNQNFITDYNSGGYKAYQPGNEIAKHIVALGLIPTRFKFCLLAGCKGAESKDQAGLYIQIGDTFAIPVVASTTPVKLATTNTQITLTPQDQGQWKVYFPAESSIYDLENERCKEIHEYLMGYVFQCLTEKS